MHESVHSALPQAHAWAEGMLGNLDEAALDPVTWEEESEGEQ